MRRYCLVIASMLFLGLNVLKAQDDGFNLYLNLQGNSNVNENRLQLRIDSRSTDNMDGSRFDGQRVLTNKTFYVGTSCEGFVLSKDTRPHLNRLYVDFGVTTKLPATEGTVNYVFSKAERTNGPLDAVSLVLIDKESESEIYYHDILTSDYVFSFESNKEVILSDRFTLRVYFASVWKENIVDGDWTEGSNWYGGKVPGGNEDYLNKNIIIPEKVSVKISSTSCNVGTLYNSGNIVVEDNASLTLESSLILDSSKNYHK